MKRIIFFALFFLSALTLVAQQKPTRNIGREQTVPLSTATGVPVIVDSSGKKVGRLVNPAEIATSAQMLLKASTTDLGNLNLQLRSDLATKSALIDSIKSFVVAFHYAGFTPNSPISVDYSGMKNGWHAIHFSNTAYGVTYDANSQATVPVVSSYYDATTNTYTNAGFSTTSIRDNNILMAKVENGAMVAWYTISPNSRLAVEVTALKTLMGQKASASALTSETNARIASDDLKWSKNGDNSLPSDYVGTNNNMSFRVKTNSIERAVFDSVGRVHIGGYSPNDGTYFDPKLYIKDIVTQPTLLSGGSRHQSFAINQVADPATNSSISYRAMETLVGVPISNTSNIGSLVGLRVGYNYGSTGSLGTATGINNLNYNQYGVTDAAYGISNTVAVNNTAFINYVWVNKNFYESSSATVSQPQVIINDATIRTAVNVGVKRLYMYRAGGFGSTDVIKVDSLYAYYVDASLNNATGTEKYAFRNESNLPIYSVGNIETLGKAKSTKIQLTDILTPSSSSDPTGAVGDITKDDNYIYVKTANGWKRSALTTF